MTKGYLKLKVLKLQCINVIDEALQAIGVFCLLLELLSLYSFRDSLTRVYVPLEKRVQEAEKSDVK